MVVVVRCDMCVHDRRACDERRLEDFRSLATESVVGHIRSHLISFCY